MQRIESLRDVFKKVHSRDAEIATEEASAGHIYYSMAFKKAQEGEWINALRLYNRALILQRKSLGIHHVVCARTLNGIGVALTQLGEAYSYGAMTALEEALCIRQDCLGDGHADVAETTNNLWKLLNHHNERNGEDARKDPPEDGSAVKEVRKALSSDENRVTACCA